VFEVGLWLIVLVPLAMVVIVGMSDQIKSMPAWFHKIAFLIRKVFKIVLYIGIAAFVIFVVLPEVIMEGAMWLFPNSRTGYAMKYEAEEKNVFIEPRPHDCEWDKAPIGNKYCHFDKIVQTNTNQNGKKEVYVNWRKVNE